MESQPNRSHIALAWAPIVVACLIPTSLFGAFIVLQTRPSSYFVTSSFSCVADSASAFVVLEMTAPEDPAGVSARLSSVDVEGAALVGALRIPPGVAVHDLSVAEMRELIATRVTTQNLLGRAAERMSVIVQFDRLADDAVIRTMELQVGEGESARVQATDLDLYWAGTECERSERSE